jgi:hypothetical protein
MGSTCMCCFAALVSATSAGVTLHSVLEHEIMLDNVQLTRVLPSFHSSPRVLVEGLDLS